MPELYIGLMSGTSLDGIDAGLVNRANIRIQMLEDANFLDETQKSPMYALQKTILRGDVPAALQIYQETSLYSHYQPFSLWLECCVYQA